VQLQLKQMSNVLLGHILVIFIRLFKNAFFVCHEMDKNNHHKIILNIFCFFSTLQMLTNIENRLEELFEQIEIMPAERVEMAEKVTYSH